MENQTIVFFEIESWVQPYIKQQLHPHICIFVTEPLSEKNAHKASKATILVIFIYSRITLTMLKKMPYLQMIATTSTGYNHIQKSVREKITVCNVPCYGKNTVAEFAFMLLLALSKKLLSSERQLKKQTVSHKQLTGLDLTNKTLGIIGTGNIGMHMAKMAHGFGMHLYAYDKCKNQNLINTYHIRYAGLATVLKKSDFISLHMPLTETTHHIINQETLTYIQPHALIINTARGELIDTKALYNALKSKHIGGAALDVLEEECLFSKRIAQLHKKYPGLCKKRLLTLEKKLIQLPNVLVTPHNAYNTQEALLRIIDTTIENIKAFLCNKPINQVV